jgi:hypothetical protein
MVSRVFSLLFLTLLSNFSAAAAPACEPDSRSDDERLTALLAIPNAHDHAEDDFSQLVASVSRGFGALWCGEAYGEGLQGASDAEVAIRLRAARSAAFYAREAWILERFRSVVQAAHARGLADSEDVSDLFKAYQAAGRFEAARRIRATYPHVELPEVPSVVEPDGPQPEAGRKVWRVDGEANRLRGEWLSLDGPALLIVTSTGCGFCRMAARELLANEVLAPLMRRHAVWLAEPSMGDTFQSVARWNEHFPAAPTLLVDEPSAWPIPGFNITPRFHFVRGGEIIHTLAGWQGGPEALQAIADGFDRLGLLDASQLPGDVFADAAGGAVSRGCPEQKEALERMRVRAPIGTRKDLDRHLAELKTGADSPLRLFSTEGRKRFLADIRFRDDGTLLGFSHGELEAQLEPREIYEVTALFGHQYFYAGRLFDPALLDAEEQRLKSMLRCD